MAHDDVEAPVQLSLLAWAPVFASFRRVLRPDGYALVYPDWERQQRAVVEQVCRDGARARV